VAVTITVTLLTGGYDAASADDRERAEWPPHPARLFCALRAAARTESDLAALRWLETQPAPTVLASELLAEQRRQTYVVTNRVEKSGGSQSHLGRTNQLKSRTRAVPVDATVTVLWSSDADERVVSSLDAMSRRIPYLGRSTGVALVAASACALGSESAAGGGRVVFEPCDLVDADTVMRVPYPGYLDALDEQFDADRPAWEVSRSAAYRRQTTGNTTVEPAPAAASPYAEVFVLRFRGLAPQPQLTVAMTQALRSRVLKAAGHDAPGVLHGHGVPGRPHAAFLALPDVGHRNADGHLLGLAVAVPELSAADRVAVARAVLGLRDTANDGVITLTVPEVGRVELEYRSDLTRPFGLLPKRWQRSSTRWTSATPLVLDRYPKGDAGVTDEVRRCLRTVGLPEPVEVRVSAQPLQPGAARLRPSDLPEKARGKLYRHVEMTFDRPIAGPVIAGAGRYLGVGLFAPSVDETALSGRGGAR
jgi:CRISPR-associated protein Csb2